MASLDSLTVLDEIPNSDGWTDPEVAGFGCLDTRRGGLPLRRLDVKGRITGLLYRIEILQEFVNACTEPLEATYLFPLPARAGVTQFQLRVGERRIKGVLKERGAARADYEQAIQAGQRAAIAEEERPDVFTVRAGNILPGETVSVTLELTGPLTFADGEATFRFPLVVAPRYIPGLALDGPSVGQGMAVDTGAVPDASRITPPVLLPGQPNPIYLTLQIELDAAGLSLVDLRTSLHTVQLRQVEPGIQRVELRPGVERLNRDFILRFRVGGDGIASSLILYRHSDGEATALLTMAPPSATVTARPRDVVVVLDRSGSMGGWKMAAARRAAGRLLDTLTEQDRFGVILFDDQVEEPAPSSGQLVVATDRNRFRAVELLGRVEARGGTEIAPALRRALHYFPKPLAMDRDRLLLFVTDGQVGNEDQLLRQIQQDAQQCRIFTVGIDQAVNASLLERLAQYGGGHCELVESEDRLDEVLRTVHRRLGRPLLTNIHLEPTLREQAPDGVDLFPGVPVRLGGRWPEPAETALVITAQDSLGQPFRQVVPVVQTTDAAVRTLWARSRILDLEHQFIAQGESGSSLADEITAFSLRYGVLCRFTAFVAVDTAETINARGPLHQVTQPVELPAGWAMPVALDMPAFLRRAAPMPMSASTQPPMDFDCDFLCQDLEFRLEEAPSAPSFEVEETVPSPSRVRITDNFGGQAKTQHVGFAAPTALPAWFMELETALTTPNWDQVQQLSALRKALEELTKRGNGMSDLVKEGWKLIKRLQGARLGKLGIERRLLRWLERLRKRLESPLETTQRRSWWR